MPTGYTAICGDNPDVTFREFAIGCARAFGACIMQRDDPAGVPMNMEEHPSSYHTDSIAELEKKRADIQNGSGPRLYREERERLGAAAAESILRSNTLRATYERMLAAVQKWMPPTPDHEGLKSFMVQQLTDSLKWDCGNDSYYRDAVARMDSTDEQTWIAKRLAEIEKNIQYHQVEYAKEVETVNARNRWKAALVKSLQ